jgi:hypothetical protein
MSHRQITPSPPSLPPSLPLLYAVATTLLAYVVATVIFVCKIVIS